MTAVDEIAPDVFRVSTLVPDLNLQFNQFLVRDDEPLLYHTGMRGLFPQVRDAVSRLIDPAQLRWISFSHFEPDECGALNEWLDIAPLARPVTSEVGAIVFMEDFASRAARGLANDEVLSTGAHRFRLRHTPHLPHGWDASMLFDETSGVLFCSDLFHQAGDLEPLTESSVVERFRDTLDTYQQGPLANYMPYTPNTERYLKELAELKPSVCAAMHGSAYAGDGAAALADLGIVLKEVYGSG
ncbi:MAG: MBL fold metallo-hydrolase [Chromatiales bacterium]|nr:MAG: MBL fold metallo-hydrolase [Chromatiales bacterium]